jgi:hypothetical protein
MDDLIPRAESERMLAEATAKVRLEYVQQIEQLKSALDAAKSQIAVLLSRIFGSKTERSAVILPAEGQQLINPEWHSDALQEKSSQQENANDKKDETSASTRKQTPRDHRGVAQRHPQLEIQVAESPVPPEIKEQVEAGSVRVERTGRYEDTLVVPPEKPFIRRVFEVQVVSTGNDQVQMQLPMPAQIVPGGVLADETIHVPVRHPPMHRLREPQSSTL